MRLAAGQAERQKWASVRRADRVASTRSVPCVPTGMRARKQPVKGMEDGVLQALRDIAEQHGIEWDPLWRALKREGRLHLETY